MSLLPREDRIGPSAALESKISFARALAESSLLPSAYRKQPANVLLAIELGEALHIPSIQAINGIHVIEGKPSASADLIAAVIRRAGHKLRVDVDDQNLAVTARLIRHDDPDYVFESVWTMEKAQRAGLTGKQNWRQHPAQMLRARAITEVARMGASDALFGVVYTPEELGADQEQVSARSGPVEEPRTLRAAMEQQQSDVPGVSSVDDAGRVPEAVEHPSPAPEQQQDAGGDAGGDSRRSVRGSRKKTAAARIPAGGCTVPQQATIARHFKRLKIEDRDKRLEWTARLAGRDETIESTKVLTEAEASAVIKTVSALRNHDQLVQSLIQDQLDADIVDAEIVESGDGHAS